MFPLPVSEHVTITALFEGLRHHLAVQAILAGEISAPVYVDEMEHARLAVTRTRQRCFLAGEPNPQAFDSLTGLFEGTIFPQMRGEGYSVLMLFFAPAGWLEWISGLFPARRVMPVARQHYSRSIGGNLPQVMLPDGFTLRLVDEELLAEANLQNLDALREEMCSERASVEEFLQKSFGVVALRGRELAGWCLSEYNCAGRCEVGIGAQEPYRRQGLATALGTAFLQQAQQRGITQVGWDCFADNLPSVATALRLGFGQAEDYTACAVWF